MFGKRPDTATAAATAVAPVATPPRLSATPSRDEDTRRRHRIKVAVHRKLIGTLDLAKASEADRGEVREIVVRLVEEAADAMVKAEERTRVVEEVLDETFGLGPLEALLADPEVTDILVNGPEDCYVERGGVLERADVQFIDDTHLKHIIDKIVTSVGRRCDETTPMVDARLKDGSRVNAVIPPLSVDGPMLSIRRFGSNPVDWDDYARLGSLAPQMSEFLQHCVAARLNIIVVGGTGSGKTTLLNNLSSFIPGSERVVTIEDTAELKLRQPHVIRLETRSANIEGKGAISIRDLVINALRMRPDRIVVGECRSSETLDMLQAMNTGHEGSMTTIHANSTRDAVQRLETMVMMAGFDLPVRAIRQQFASAVHLIVQSQRLPGGSRKVTAITEVTGMEGDIVTMQDIFRYAQDGVGADGNAYGGFEATGIRPGFLDQLRTAGREIDTDMFRARRLE